MNLAEAGAVVADAASLYEDIQGNIDEFVNENEDAAWQSPDVVGIIGLFSPEDVQIQTRDYVSEIEQQQQEQQQEGGGGGGGGGGEGGEGGEGGPPPP